MTDTALIPAVLAPEEQIRKVYIVLSQTGTLVGKLLYLGI